MENTGAPSQAAEKQENQKGEIGIWTCTTLVIGTMIGSGVFLLPASLATYGALSIFGWIITSAGAMVMGLLFGRLAKLVTRSGGPYAYTQEGFGDFAGFLMAWGYWISMCCSIAGVSVAMTGYVSYLVPAVGESVALQLCVALGVLWSLILIQLRGISSAGFIQIVTTALKIIPLLAIAAVGLFYISPENYTPINPSGQAWYSAIPATVTLTLWAYLGLEAATVPSGNVKNPSVTIPRATVIGIAFSALLYIVITLVAVGTIPADQLKNSSAPLADVAALMWGPVGATLVAVGAIVSTLGTMNGLTILMGQTPYGGAQGKVFPQFFAKTNSRGAPARSLLISGLIPTALVAINLSRGLVETFTVIALLTVFCLVVPYLFSALSELMIIARRGIKLEAKEMSKLIILSVIGFAYTFIALIGAGETAVFYGFLLLLAGVPVYIIIRVNPAKEQ
ncbi:amino acid permease [Rhodobacteraceae bacterium RKSG542]|uniref:amino acid permease n=1 Tax=Pseudovibrio flavus TaxID=2529854 RepID=UPI0012BB6F90|nr:amino acid permease [Pseudovibrio flavus]MTI16321.1 amino acid permease [Pseudovibrio flavus]